MDKQKFDEKCAELYAHEDQILAAMQDHIKLYNDELNQFG